MACVISKKWEHIVKIYKEGSKDSDRNITLFFKGKAGAWRDLLDEKIVKEVENKFQKEMKELGYIN